MVFFWFFVLIVASYVVAAAYTDSRMQRIPNFLTVPVAAGGILWGVVFSILPGRLPEWPWHLAGWQNSLLGLAVGFGLLFVPFAIGGGGPGDVKLMAALGAWLGPLYVFVAFVLALFAALAAAAVVVSVASSQKLAANTKGRKADKPNQNTASGGSSPTKGQRRRRSVPFAIPVAIGTWCVLGFLVLKVTLAAGS